MSIERNIIKKLNDLLSEFQILVSDDPSKFYLHFHLGQNVSGEDLWETLSFNIVRSNEDFSRETEFSFGRRCVRDNYSQVSSKEGVLESLNLYLGDNTLSQNIEFLEDIVDAFSNIEKLNEICDGIFINKHILPEHQELVKPYILHEIKKELLGIKKRNPEISIFRLLENGEEVINGLKTIDSLLGSISVIEAQNFDDLQQVFSYCAAPRALTSAGSRSGKSIASAKTSRPVSRNTQRPEQVLGVEFRFVEELESPTFSDLLNSRSSSCPASPRCNTISISKLISKISGSKELTKEINKVIISEKQRKKDTKKVMREPSQAAEVGFNRRMRDWIRQGNLNLCNQRNGIRATSFGCSH